MSQGTLRRLARAYSDSGLSTVIDQSLGRLLVEPRIWSRFRWRVSSLYYRANCASDLRAFSAPPDPFKLEWVDPDAIRRNTRRPYPAWRDRQEDFGAVRGGDWDRRQSPDVASDYDGTPPHLYVADRFEETTLFRSLEAHFVRGIPWVDTEFVAEARRLLDAGRCQRVWNGCRSAQDIRDRCQSLDQLYATIEGSGYRSQRELVATDPDATFRDWIREEVLVDVGREGDLLLVNGRHRLSLAKLLGIDRIPVLFLVRHPEWMAHRERVSETGEATSHPDLRDLRR